MLVLAANHSDSLTDEADFDMEVTWHSPSASGCQYDFAVSANSLLSVLLSPYHDHCIFFFDKLNGERYPVFQRFPNFYIFSYICSELIQYLQDCYAYKISILHVPVSGLVFLHKTSPPASIATITSVTAGEGAFQRMQDHLAHVTYIPGSKAYELLFDFK